MQPAAVILPLAGLLLLTLAAPGAAHGQERRLVREVNVDAEDKDLAELMGELARATGKTILVAEHVSERVSVRLFAVSWRDAVEVIARLTRCTVKELPGDVLLLTQPQRVSVQLEGASVRTALLLLARYAKASIVLSPRVQGTISLSLRDVDWHKALHAVANAAGGYQVLRDGDLITVGGAGGERLETTETPIREGRFLAREGDAIRVALDAEHALRCLLPEDQRLRERLLAAIAALRPGDRIVFSATGSGDALTLANLVARGR
jgi:type II secretory pathway component HofQ